MNDRHRAAGGREHRAQDKLGSGFRAVVAVFVEGHEAGHGDAGHFQSDVEYQEMPGGHHEEHAQQGGERQHVELTLFIMRVFPPQPFAALEEDKQRAGRKDGLDDGRERGVDVHAAEECAGVGRKVQSYLECHQHANDRMKPTLAMAAHEKVGQEATNRINTSDSSACKDNIADKLLFITWIRED